MKKIVKITSLLLVVTTLCLFAMACSSYGKLEKAFLDNGYEIVEEIDNDSQALKAELEKDELAVTVHGFKKTGLLTGDLVLVIEFKATDDLVKACKENNTLKGAIQDIKEDEDVKAAYDKLVEEGYAKGNCLVFSFNPLNMSAVKTIVKNA